MRVFQDKKQNHHESLYEVASQSYFFDGVEKILKLCENLISLQIKSSKMRYYNNFTQITSINPLSEKRQ